MESLQIPQSEAFDRKLTQDDFKSIYHQLKQLSSRWYSIGAYLVHVPLLEEIDADHREVTIKLIQLLHHWLNNANNCTWRTLIAAVQAEQYFDVAKSIIQYVCEGGVAYNDTPKKSNEKSWVESEVGICTEEEEFQLVQQSVTRIQNKCMKSLRDKLRIDSKCSHKRLLGLIEKNFLEIECANECLLPIKFDQLIDIFKEISKNLHNGQESLCKWAEALFEGQDEVSDFLHELYIQKELLKEGMFWLEIENNSNHDVTLLEQKVQNRTQARDIVQQMADTESYQEFLSDKIQTCKRRLNKAIQQSESIARALRSVICIYKEVVYTMQLIALFAMITLPRHLGEAGRVIISIFVLSILIIFLMKSICPCVRQVWDRLARISFVLFAVMVNHRRKVCTVLGVLMAIMPLFVQQLPILPPPIEPLAIAKGSVAYFIACAIFSFLTIFAVCNFKRESGQFCVLVALLVQSIIFLVYILTQSGLDNAVIVVAVIVGICAFKVRKAIKVQFFITVQSILSHVPLLAVYIGSRNIDLICPFTVIAGVSLAGPIASRIGFWLASKSLLQWYSKEIKCERLLQENISKLQLMRAELGDLQGTSPHAI